MWDHWRGGIFTDSETLNDENKLLKCIAEKQRKEMILLAKQIAALAKRKELIDDKKENSIAEQVSTDPSVELGQGQNVEDKLEVVTWALDAETNDTSPIPVPVEPVPAISASQSMKSTTLQPQFKIEALRKQPRKNAPKRSRSPDRAGRSQPVRKTRKLRNITAKQKRSIV